MEQYCVFKGGKIQILLGLRQIFTYIERLQPAENSDLPPTFSALKSSLDMHKML